MSGTLRPDSPSCDDPKPVEPVESVGPKMGLGGVGSGTWTSETAETSSPTRWSSYHKSTGFRRAAASMAKDLRPFLAPALLLRFEYEGRTVTLGNSDCKYIFD